MVSSANLLEIPPDILNKYRGEADSYFRNNGFVTKQPETAKYALRDFVSGYLSVRDQASSKKVFDVTANYLGAKTFIEGYSIIAGLNYSLEGVVDNTTRIRTDFGSIPDLSISTPDPQMKTNLILHGLLKSFSDNTNYLNEDEKL